MISLQKFLNKKAVNIYLVAFVFLTLVPRTGIGETITFPNFASCLAYALEHGPFGQCFPTAAVPTAPPSIVPHLEVALNGTIDAAHIMQSLGGNSKYNAMVATAMAGFQDIVAALAAEGCPMPQTLPPLTSIANTTPKQRAAAMINLFDAVAAQLVIANRLTPHGSSNLASSIQALKTLRTLLVYTVFY